jgi:hypothetical protein
MHLSPAGFGHVAFAYKNNIFAAQRLTIPGTCLSIMGRRARRAHRQARRLANAALWLT